jgi:hypothetical protein
MVDKTKFLVRGTVSRGHGVVLVFSILLVATPVQSQAENGVRIPGNLCSWQNMSWRDLNAAEKLAWSGLGWTKQRWDNPDPANYPASYGKSWPELVYTEKLLARKLGYSRKTWDAEGCPNYSTRARKKPVAPGQAGTNISTD